MKVRKKIIFQIILYSIAAIASILNFFLTELIAVKITTSISFGCYLACVILNVISLYNREKKE